MYIHFWNQDLVAVSTTIHNDLVQTKELKRKVDETVQDIIIGIGIVDSFKNPNQANGQYLKSHVSFPLEFFMKKMEDMKERLGWYKNSIDQIERKLSSIIASPQPPSPQCSSKATLSLTTCVHILTLQLIFFSHCINTTSSTYYFPQPRRQSCGRGCRAPKNQRDIYSALESRNRKCERSLL